MPVADCVSVKPPLVPNVPKVVGRTQFIGAHMELNE